MKKIIPFDIEKAKNGAEVINMLGEKIKIIYYDVKSCYPIVGLRFDKTTGTEILNTYTKEGKYIELCYSSDQDLQIVEEVSTYNEIIDEMFERRYKLLCYFADKNLQPVEEVITYDEIFEIIDEITRAVDKNIYDYTEKLLISKMEQQKKKNIRIAYCEESKRLVVQEKSDFNNKWLCLHNETEEEDYKDVLTFIREELLKNNPICITLSSETIYLDDKYFK